VAWRCTWLDRSIPKHGIRSKRQAIAIATSLWVVGISFGQKVAEKGTSDVTVMSPQHGKSGSIRVKWFQAAQSNSAFMGTLLCIASMHRYRRDLGSYLEVLEQVSSVVQQVNVSLANPSLATSPGSIVAVTYLLFISVSPLPPPPASGFRAWDVEQQPAVHLRGLRRMLYLAGGIDAFRGDRLLYTCLLWLVYL
jgi:hypothetical protein